MADDTVTLTFLAEQGRRILVELGDLRAEAEIMRTDNRRVLGDRVSNCAADATPGGAPRPRAFLAPLLQPTCPRRLSSVQVRT